MRTRQKMSLVSMWIEEATSELGPEVCVGIFEVGQMSVRQNDEMTSPDGKKCCGTIFVCCRYVLLSLLIRS